MKIRSITVNQFKKFTTPTCLKDINDGLNILVGPNEMGKSTLLDALRATLFEKYSSKSIPVRSLQNDRNQAAPVVELEFEIDKELYRIRKRFVKKPYAHMFCPDGRKFEGDHAEETLSDLLQFDEPGKSGAKSETLGMWNVLWVQQSQSFGVIDLPDSARGDLHSALELEVGDVLGGKRGKVLLAAVSAQLAELCTSTGKPRGDYKKQIELLETLQSKLKGLLADRSELSGNLDALEVAYEDLERLSSTTQDQEDEDELEIARTRHGELAKLDERIKAATSDVALKKQTLEQAEDDLTKRLDLKAQTKVKSEAVESAKEKLEEVREKDLHLKEQVEKLRQDVNTADSVVTEAANAVMTARRIHSAVLHEGRRHELQDRYEKAYEAEAKLRTAEQAADDILVTDKNMKEIRKVARTVDQSYSRLSTTATLIAFDMPQDCMSKVEVDGATLADGRTSVEAVEKTTISIPDYGDISVHPAIKNKDKLIAQLNEAKAALKVGLDKCCVESVDDAEKQLAKRKALLKDAEHARKEVELYAPKTDDCEAGAEALADYIESLKVIHEQGMTDLGNTSLPSEKEAEQVLVSAQESAEDARENQTSTRSDLDRLEETQLDIQSELGRVEARYEDGKKQLDQLRSSLAEADEQTSEDDLEALITDAREALVNQEKVVSDLEGQREGDTLLQLEARISRLEAVLQERQEKRLGLEKKVVRLESFIEAAEGVGIDEAIQQTEREITQAESLLQRYQSDEAVLSLLLETISTAEAEAKERYLAPVQKTVRPYLQILFPDAEIAIDDDLHIVGVLRDGGYEEPFDQLSLGTQEQIAVLVRLAFAELLVKRGHPATVVLDDALVFSDDRRMDSMFDILNMVAQEVQIIILTCREQLFEGVGGHHLSLEQASEKDLESA